MKLKNILSSLLLVICGISNSATLPVANGRPLLPDDWLLSPGQDYFFKATPGNGRVLGSRQPTYSERDAISRIQDKFANMPSKAFLLGDGDKIVKTEFRYPAREDSTFMSASIDKTVTAMSAGVAICDGKINLNTKAKDVLPELDGTYIGETTLRDNLTMTSNVTRAQDDSQSMTRDELEGIIYGRISFMNLLKGRLGQKESMFLDHGQNFSYKTQDPTLVAMMISGAYNLNGKKFREWQNQYFFPKVKVNDRRYQGQDQFGYAMAEGNTRMTIQDWARFAIFVQESRKESGCYGNFVRQATSTQVRTDKRFTSFLDGYGYFTWTDSRISPNSYSALGYGGQAIIWSTTSDKYVVIFSNSAFGRETAELAKLWLDSQ